MAVENIVDDIPWFQRAFQNRDVSLRIEESQNILPDEVGEGPVEGPAV